MKICVTSYGSISIHKNNRYTNPAITSLLNHLAQQNEVFYLAQYAGKNASVYNGDKPVYIEKISEKVRVIALHPQNTKNRFQGVTNFCKNLIILCRYITQIDLMYVYLPSYSNLLASIFTLIVRKKIALYIGADWKALQGMKRRNIVSSFYSRTYAFFVERIYDQALFVLVTGEQIFTEINKKGRRVFQTIPSVSFKKYENQKPKGESTDSYRCVNIFFAGPINERKGILYLIKSLPILTQKGLQVHLHLAGTIEKTYQIKIEQEIKENHLSEYITFHGYLADPSVLAELYTKMNFFVLPSLAEGFPRAIYEAMMSGLPVISTDLPSIRGNLDDPEIIFFVPQKDPEAIAKALLELVNNPSKRKKLIEKG